MTETEPTIFVSSAAGYIAFHRHNERAARCPACRAHLEPGVGVYRKTARFLSGTGYLCQPCARAALASHAQYSYQKQTASLFPFDGVISTYPIPSASLLSAWETGKAAGLRAAAERLREQARREFLTANGVEYVPDKY